ncbi:hypothetical protein ACH5RR_010710 [Cinchona calisaya]|uniref:Uncharacterized protein n=1 Tax=Cinchona calisaya TaxID=153742 RepID=A0ABD3AJP4_9GENT
MSDFNGTGENSGSDEDENERMITGESEDHIQRYTAEERFTTWTESLGFESLNERAICRYTPAVEEEGNYQSPTAGGSRSSSRRRKIKPKSCWLDMSKFPPLMSTLNVNGRFRFDFIKIRENGRLRMMMVPSERPEVGVLQTPPMVKEKRLKMMLIRTDFNQDHDHDYDDDQE